MLRQILFFFYVIGLLFHISISSSVELFRFGFGSFEIWHVLIALGIIPVVFSSFLLLFLRITRIFRSRKDCFFVHVMAFGIVNSLALCVFLLGPLYAYITYIGYFALILAYFLYFYHTVFYFKVFVACILIAFVVYFVTFPDSSLDLNEYGDFYYSGSVFLEEELANETVREKLRQEWNFFSQSGYLGGQKHWAAQQYDQFKELIASEPLFNQEPKL